MRRWIVVAGVVAALSGGFPATAAAAAGGGISGRVTDADGTPLSGVTINVESLTGSGASTTSGADGTFGVADLPADEYYVCFSAQDAVGGSSPSGYLDTCWQDVPAWDGISLSDVTSVDVAAGSSTPGIDQALSAAGGITGTVTDATGHPLSGAVVYADMGPGSPARPRGEATTDADGTYVIDRLPPSDLYAVCASATNAIGGTSATGYLDQCTGHLGGQDLGGIVPFGEPVTFPVMGGTRTAADPLPLDAAAQLSGTLTDTRTGAPISGIRVYAWAQNGGSLTAAGTTAADGSFLLSVDDPNGSANGEYHGTRLPADDYTLLFSASGRPDYVSAYYMHVSSPGGSVWGTTTTVTPVPGTPTVVTDHLDRAGSIAGRITDTSGHPLSGVRVTVGHAGATVKDMTTGASGTYLIGGLPAADYTVCFDGEGATGGTSHAGYFDRCSGGSPTTAPATVRLGYAAKMTGVNASLASASGIVGRVTNGNGRGIFSVHVTISSGGRIVGSAYTRFDGTYRSPRLPAGQYTVCFRYVSTAPPAYQPECYNDLPTTSPLTPVPTVAGSLTTVNAVLGLSPPLPDRTAPTVRVTAPTALAQADRAITVRYTGSDAQTGVAGFDVQYRTAAWKGSFGAYVSPAAWQHRTSPNLTLTGVAGRTYCFRVRARDRAGNTSGYSAPRCVTIPLDDRSLKRSSGWRSASSSSAYLRTETVTTVYGATLTLARARAGRIAVVVVTCPTCGTVGIVVNGRVVSRISTYSATTHTRMVKLTGPFAARTATIQLKLLQRHRRLVVDGLAVLPA